MFKKRKRKKKLENDVDIQFDGETIEDFEKDFYSLLRKHSMSFLERIQFSDLDFDDILDDEKTYEKLIDYVSEKFKNEVRL